MRILGIAIGIVCIILCHWFVIGITTLIYLTTAGDYISAVLSAVFLSIMFSENLYQKPKEKIDSVVKAFKKGYTNLMSKYLIAYLPIKLVIHLLYLCVLLTYHVNSLGYVNVPENILYLCELNRYGIVILYAGEKMIKEIGKDKPRRRILSDTFDENEN